MNASPADPGPHRLGDFEIVRELGRGGMGVVYEARQVSLNRKVALKVLAGGLGLTPRAVERFHREAQAAAKLHHTNIVPVYAVGEQDGTHFYAMELIEGPSLDHVIRQLRRQPPGPSESAALEVQATGPYIPATPFSSSPGLSESSLSSGGAYFDAVARMIADVADALDHAHKHGVVHRDIKPSNLLLSPDGRLSVNDFGLARMLEQPGMTVTGEFLGTPAYMSPEQVTAGHTPLDHRTDIYSLGATLYQLLTLQPPFRGERRDQVLAQIIHKETKPPRSLNRKVPIDLETICLKAMDKDPDRRYQTAAAMAEDLRRYVNRFAISARRAGPVARLKKWVKRNPALAGAAAAVLLAGCLAGFFAWQARERDKVLRTERQATALEKAVTAALNGQNDEAVRQIAAAETLGAPREELSKVRGIIALYQGEPGTAVSHLTIASGKLGSAVAVKALLAAAYFELGDVRGEPLITELGPLEPQTAEDFLFKGQVISLFDDPRVGLRDIEQALRLKPSPLARLALAEGRVQLAFDTGAHADATAAVRDAELARQLLPNSDRALGAFLQSRLVLWDYYTDRAGPGDPERASEQWTAAGQLVQSAGLRRGSTLTWGCQYYHERSGVDGATLKYLWGIWDTTRDPFIGEQMASSLLQSGDRKRVREVLDVVRQVRGDRGRYDWYARAFLQAEEGEGDAGYREFQAQGRSAGHDSLIFASLALLLGKPEEACRAYANALASGRIPPWHHGWYRDLARYGAGEGGANEDKAILDRAGGSRMHQCEAHYHIGLRHLARGDREGAEHHFDEAVKTRVFAYFEHTWAGLFLTRIKADPGWPRWIKK